MILEIPIKGTARYAHSSFRCTLEQREIEFILNYCAFLEVWDLTVKEDGEYIITGATLVAGADLLANAHTDLGRLYLLGEDPTLDNLGVTNTLVWISSDESI